MLTVAHLAQPHIERSKRNHETYRGIYATCVENIKRKHGAGCTETVWEVPAFVPGRPLFAHSHAVRYVSDKLRFGGFQVDPVAEATLKIDWAQGVRDSHRQERLQKKAKPARAETLAERVRRLQRRMAPPR